ncbi:MAG: ATP-binding protein [Chloroflexota bacterium]
MNGLLTQISNLITTPPGNLSYHLILTFTIAGTLSTSYRHWVRSQFPQGRRLVIGLILLLVARLVIFFGVGLSWQGIGSPSAFLPPLDRAVDLFSLVIIIWVWCFPEPTNIADIATVLSGLFVLTFFGLSWGIWTPYSSTYVFNLHWLNTAWETFSLFFALMGGLILAIRKPNRWDTGVVIVCLLFIGHSLSLLLPISESNFPAAVRLSQMIAYPLLFYLTQRFPLPGGPRLPQPDEQELPQKRRYSTDLKTLDAILTLTGDPPTENLYENITRAVANAMLADLCLLITPPNTNDQMTILCGYDLIREVHLRGGSLNKQHLPILTTALEKNRALRLPASSTSADLLGMGMILGIGRAGPMLAMPLTLSNNKTLGAVVLLSPYSNRTWTAGDQAYLQTISIPLAKLMQYASHRTTYKEQLEKTVSAMEAADKEINRLRQKCKILEAEVEGRKTSDDQIDAAIYLSTIEEAQSQIAKLEEDNRELETRLKKLQEGRPKPDEDIERVKGEMVLALEEVFRLNNALTKAQDQIMELKRQPPTDVSIDIDKEQSEILASLTQELRQPMSSIIGYTDLLLEESVGILGALQRKFLERIKASVERLDSLVNDLIRSTALDHGTLTLTPEPVDLNGVIDEAIANTSQQLREKNIILRVDLPERLPKIMADRDALQQILINLVKNAGLATPMDGEICLRAHIEGKKNGKETILIQVTDSGGGIPEDDIPRVFSRLYRADNPLIQGVGDTGVGLSIAKALVEANEGQIFVESEIGKGATFSILLPIYSEPDYVE